MKKQEQNLGEWNRRVKSRYSYHMPPKELQRSRAETRHKEEQRPDTKARDTTD